MAIVDVCRLCLSTDDLVYIFNEENRKLKMNDIISITTGIEIHTKDIISQKVCNKCYQFSIKVFQFRGQCLKADKYLKGLCMEYLVDKKYYIPNTEVTIKGVIKSEQHSKPKPVFLKPQPTYKVHPTVVNLSRKYPDMKLPKICLTSNVTPSVEMELHQVENHFRRLKLDFNFYVKNALVSSKKYFRQNKALASSTNIEVGKIEGDKKDKQEAVKLCEIESNNKEICRTPNKSSIRGNSLKSPVRNGVKRKLTEPSPKEKVDEALCKTGTSDSNHNNSTNKKTKAVRECLQKNPDPINGDKGADSFIQPATKRSKLSDENRESEKGTGKRTYLVRTEKDCFSCSPKNGRKSLPNENDLNGRSNDEKTNDMLKKFKKPPPIRKFTEKVCKEKERRLPMKISEKEKTEERRLPMKISEKEKTDERRLPMKILEKEKTDERRLPMKISENSGNDGNNLSSAPVNELSINQQEIQKENKDDGELLTNVGRSVPLFVCEICNSVQYNMYELKKHKLKHMRCQFCKIRLRSLENKRHHIENVCIIKKMMQNLPSVQLVKIEYNRTVRRTYQEAFAGFPPLPETDRSDTVSTAEIPNLKNVLFKDFPPERLDIIEILSDEDVPIVEAKHPPLVLDVTSDVLAKLDLSVSTEEVVRNVKAAFQKYSEETATQTDLPGNDDVTVCENGRIILKNLQPQMSIYPITVNLLPGQFDVSFDYKPDSDSVKELSFWDDLTPTDVVPETENCFPSSVVVTETPNGNTPDQDKGTEDTELKN